MDKKDALEIIFYIVSCICLTVFLVAVLHYGEGCTVEGYKKEIEIEKIRRNCNNG